MKSIQIIPSKSDAHRALIAAFLADEAVDVIYSASSEDIEATQRCLKALAQGKTDLYCGESGSTFRFLLPLVPALGRQAAFHPEGRLAERPLSPLYEELRRHGCQLSPQGQVPFWIKGPLQAGHYQLAGNVSSQFISGLLFALPLLDQDSEIEIIGPLESADYVAMTLDTLAAFNIEIIPTPKGLKVPAPQVYHRQDNYQVEADWSNACFWLVAGALLDEGIECRGLDPKSKQGDKAIVDILQEFGANVQVNDSTVQVKKDQLRGLELDAQMIPDMIPALAVLAALATGTTRIYHASRLRLKESDRLQAICQTLHTLGADIQETEDGLLIHGSAGRLLEGGKWVDSYQDHRIAMMAAIASIACQNPVTLQRAQAVNKSYPTFFQDLADLGLDYKLITDY